jgi:hypothetical protein
VSTAQFSLDSAKRVPAYLHAGKDANQFPSWNQEHFPMQEATKPNANASTSGSPPKITSQVQYDALPPGASYTDANGKPHKKGGK